MTSAEKPGQPYGLAVFLIVAGALGWLASFALTLEKFHLLDEPDAVLSCDFSLVVQCGANLASAQGAAFGFPNPLIGLGGFVAPIAVGVGLLAGARFANWLWILFDLGIAGALAFVIWLIGQSIFVLGTLCPWCMLVWAVTIPLFWAVTLHILATGKLPVPARARRFFAVAYTWVPAITLVSYLVVAVIAQARLNVLAFV